MTGRLYQLILCRWLGALALTIVLESKQMSDKLQKKTAKQPFWLYWGLAMAVLAGLMLFGMPNAEFEKHADAEPSAQLSAAH